MLGLVLRVLAFLLFLVAAVSSEGVAGQPPLDLVAFGLAAWVLATLVGDYWPRPRA